MSRRTAVTGTGRALIAVLAVAAAAGCSNSTQSTDDGGSLPANCVMGPMGYPGGPYGANVGDTICDLTLRVQVGANGAPATKNLSDYKADKTLKVLALFGAAEWCSPCKAEQPELVTDYNEYKTAGSGVAFLEAVTQKNDMSPSDDGTVKDWANQFSVPFELASDPDNHLGPYFDPATFPNTLIIRLSDMTIRANWAGKIAGMTKQAIDAALQ